MSRVVFALLVMVVACGPVQARPATSPSAAATPAATPTASAALLIAALEAKGTANPEQWNTVAIAGLDGYARAKTTFVPMPVPNVGCTAAVLPFSAHVAAGRVYFSDGAGVVRSFSVQGRITQVATFPLTSGQQMLSFAVSPDGSRLLGAVFTLPAKPNLACSGTPAAGGYSLDVYSALAGSASTLLYHQSLPNTDVMALVGWDRVGPIATYPTTWATQGGGPTGYYGTPVRVDSTTGKVLKQVSDPSSCAVWDIGLSGDFTCVPAGAAYVSIRRPDGSEVWRVGPSPNGYYYFLSPDEKHVVALGDAGLEVLGRDATRVKLAGGFFPEGWLDSATVIGTGIGNTGRGNLSFVALGAPGTSVDMGFKGVFVGTVQS